MQGRRKEPIGRERERERVDELLEDEGSMPRWPSCDLAPEDAIDGFLLKNEHAAEAHTDTRRRDMFFLPLFFRLFYFYETAGSGVEQHRTPNRVRSERHAAFKLETNYTAVAI